MLLQQEQENDEETRNTKEKSATAKAPRIAAHIEETEEEIDE
jgi:hypothetical protein